MEKVMVVIEYYTVIHSPFFSGTSCSEIPTTPMSWCCQWPCCFIYHHELYHLFTIMKNKVGSCVRFG